MAKKVKKSAEAEGAADAAAGVSIYDAAIDELKAVADSDATRRKVETSALKEGRGQDVLRLHTTLKAIDAAHGSLASQVAAFQTETDANFTKTREAAADGFDKTWSTLDKKFEKTWDTSKEQFEKTWDTLGANFQKTWKTSDGNFEKTWSTLETSFDKTWQTLQKDFDKTWEAMGQNFESMNERTKREVHDLREELTRVLDKRFTHIDQTFASIRADIEVLKALQMELIKERIGRPELVKR